MTSPHNDISTTDFDIVPIALAGPPPPESLSKTGISESDTRTYFPETWLWQLNTMPLVWCRFRVLFVN